MESLEHYWSDMHITRVNNDETTSSFMQIFS